MWNLRLCHTKAPFIAIQHNCQLSIRRRRVGGSERRDPVEVNGALDNIFLTIKRVQTHFIRYILTSILALTMA